MSRTSRWLSEVTAREITSWLLVVSDEDTCTELVGPAEQGGEAQPGLVAAGTPRCVLTPLQVTATAVDSELSEKVASFDIQMRTKTLFSSLLTASILALRKVPLV